MIPIHCQHNGHMYYIILDDLSTRTNLIHYLKQHNINAVFHYVPLHSSPAGQYYGRCSEDLINTDDLSDRLLRLPLFPTLTFEQVEFVVSKITEFLAM